MNDMLKFTLNITMEKQMIAGHIYVTNLAMEDVVIGHGICFGLYRMPGNMVRVFCSDRTEHTSLYVSQAIHTRSGLHGLKIVSLKEISDTFYIKNPCHTEHSNESDNIEKVIVDMSVTVRYVHEGLQGLISQKVHMEDVFHENSEGSL